MEFWYFYYCISQYNYRKNKITYYCDTTHYTWNQYTIWVVISYLLTYVIITIHSIDIDECASSPCDHNCTNFDGGFICSCDEGYELNENQQSCDGMYGCENIQCVRKKNLMWLWLLEVYTPNRIQNPTACHNIFNYISWTHCGRTTKILSHVDYDPIIIHKAIQRIQHSPFWNIKIMKCFETLIRWYPIIYGSPKRSIKNLQSVKILF